MVVFDFKIFIDNINAVPYATAFYPVSKLNMKWDRDLTNEEIGKCFGHV